MTEHTYRWASLHDWLREQIDLQAVQLFDLWPLIESVDGDTIQDHFESQMDDDGYFSPAEDEDESRESAIAQLVSKLDRAEAISILESYGFACFPSESTQLLKDAITANVLDDTIPEEELHG